jgi:hypothetical protein
MMSSTVDRFKLHLQTLHSNENPRLSSYNNILRESVCYYMVLSTGINQWLPTTKTNSVYMNNGGGVTTPTLPRGEVDDKSKPKPTHDGKGNLIDRTGPGTGGATVRDSKVFPGKKDYWCGTCDRWGSHDINHHNAWKQKNKEFFANRKKSNNNVSTPSGGGNNTSGRANMVAPVEESNSTTPDTVMGSSNLSMMKRLTFHDDV